MSSDRPPRTRFTRAHADARLMCIGSELERALQHDEFYLEYQPRVHPQTLCATSAEALIRWRHPTHGLISPNEFIPTAEHTGLVIPLGKWVMHTVGRQIANWRQSGLPIVPVSVNVSYAQLQQEDFVACLGKLLRDHDLGANLLELEVTESTLAEHPAQVAQTLCMVREMGVKVALDDFGAGYTSLRLLQTLGIDTMKIDHSMLRMVEGTAGAIASCLISLGHSLSLSVVAEGIESVQQWEFCRDHGCDEVQGFLFSRPLHPDNLAQWLTESPGKQCSAPGDPPSIGVPWQEKIPR